MQIYEVIKNIFFPTNTVFLKRVTALKHGSEEGYSDWRKEGQGETIGHYRKEVVARGGVGLFSWLSSDRTRGNFKYP